ncbi:MAG: hypothetical protein ACI4O8_11595 [Aristaeellaceae bacterium]
MMRYLLFPLILFAVQSGAPKPPVPFVYHSTVQLNACPAWEVKSAGFVRIFSGRKRLRNIMNQITKIIIEFDGKKCYNLQKGCKIHILFVCRKAQK